MLSHGGVLGRRQQECIDNRGAFMRIGIPTRSWRQSRERNAYAWSRRNWINAHRLRVAGRRFLSSSSWAAGSSVDADDELQQGLAVADKETGPEVGALEG